MTLYVIKCTMVLFDILAFPIYFLFQRRCNHNKHQVKGIKLNNTDPYSAIVRYQKGATRSKNIKTIDKLFQEVIEKNKDKNCFGTRKTLKEVDVEQDGKVFKKFIQSKDYVWMTFNEVDKKLDILTKALLALNLKAYTKVALFAETRVEWMLTAQACFRMNIAVVTLIPTLDDEGIVHSLNLTKVEFIFITAKLLPKLKELLPRIPHLKTIIYMEDFSGSIYSEQSESVKIISFSEFEAMSSCITKGSSIEAPKPDDLAVIMFTSGSTGLPKGVEVTHNNIVFTATTFSSSVRLENIDSFLAYLPLAHVLELTVELMALINNQSIAYSSPLTLTNKSIGVVDGELGDIMLAKPSLIAAVPLVLEQIKKNILQGAKEKGPFASAFLNICVEYKRYWCKKGYDTPILNRIVFKKIRDSLGGRLHVIAFGSAPLAEETGDFVSACLSIILVPAYGLTESTAAASVGYYNDRSTGHAGYPAEDVLIKLIDWEEGGYNVNDIPNPRGEIIIGGEGVAAGYYNDDKLTNECFFKENGIRWFQSGDIGEILPNGALKVIDRKKDLIKLQNGEYVALGKIEMELKTSSYISNACVIGNSYHDYLVALIIPNKDKLLEFAQYSGKELNNFYSDPETIGCFLRILQEHCVKSKLSKREIPRNIKICQEEWLPETGLVTATMKIKRKKIENFYEEEIKRLYREMI